MIRRPWGGNGRIRVTLFTTRLGGGGAERQLVNVANHLDRQRFDVRVAAMRAGGTYATLLRNDVEVQTFGRAGAILPAARLVSHLWRQRPDIICSFLDGPTTLAVAATRVAAPDVRTVACVQAPVSVAHADAPWWRRRAMLLALERADRVIAISEGVAQDLVKLVPRAGERTTVIYNAGVDGSSLSAADVDLPNGIERPRGNLLVACGRLAPQKGYEYLLEAVALSRADPVLHLWIVGEGELRASLEMRARDLGIRDRVDFLGFQPNPLPFMQQADVFVLSSVFEGFGNVIVEAMACGTPVVATDCQFGPAEITRGGRVGVLVQPRDAQALAEAIDRLMRDPAHRRTLSEAGRKRARDFDPSRIAQQYARVFDQVLQNTASARGRAPCTNSRSAQSPRER